MLRALEEVIWVDTDLLLAMLIICQPQQVCRAWCAIKSGRNRRKLHQKYRTLRLCHAHVKTTTVPQAAANTGVFFQGNKRYFNTKCTAWEEVN